MYACNVINVCIDVCMYVCMHACMYVCLYFTNAIYMFLCTWIQSIRIWAAASWLPLILSKTLSGFAVCACPPRRRLSMSMTWRMTTAKSRWDYVLLKQVPTEYRRTFSHVDFCVFLVFLVCTAACRCYSYKVPRRHHLFRPRCCVRVGWSFVSFFWKTSAENCRFVFLQCPNIFRVFVFSLVYWIHWPNDVQQHWRSHLATDPPLALICGVGFRVCRTIFVFCHIGTWRWFIHIAKFYDAFLGTQ